ncbi:hypothetical protein [Streptomyces formicae]|uniref:Integral membrane protein n=1 Tax=Streptomyces formicae TaxID=1616117 RepID=A0ABY3WDL2_9ACTN|nr:hypothetical protein [Streptomyces formicae]UNM10649.1 hypothetical protein J4032_03235 [Streptomyces formicae]
MNRRLSLALAGGCANAQAMFLFAFHPVLGRMSVGDAQRLAERDVRLFGLDFDGFAVKDYSRLDGWLPQAVFVVLSAVLTYAVLRAAPGVRPCLRTALALLGAMLLAAGVAELLGPVLDPEWHRAVLTDDEWVLRAHVDQVASAPVQFALCIVLVPLVSWGVMWLLRSWPPVRALVGNADAADGGGQQTASASGLPRRRRDVVFAGLIPVVLLAIAGGPVLRHSAVRRLESPSVTFDPDLWLPYRPPAWAEKWSGVLYPALRMRPLSTEESAAWAATLGVCLVLLVVLAVALHAVVGPVAHGRPLRLFLGCWYATLLAAVAAAFVESGLLQGAAPRPDATEFVRPFDAAIGDAVRFGTAWGWTTGAACLAAVLVMKRRRRRAEPSGVEGD